MASKVLITKANSPWGIIISQYISNRYEEILSFDDDEVRDEFIDRKLFKQTDFDKENVYWKSELEKQPSQSLMWIDCMNATFQIDKRNYPNETMYSLLNKDFCIIKESDQILFFAIKGVRKNVNVITYTAYLDVFFNYDIKGIMKNNPIPITRTHLDRYIKIDGDNYKHNLKSDSLNALIEEQISDDIKEQLMTKQLGYTELGLLVYTIPNWDNDTRPPDKSWYKIKKIDSIFELFVAYENSHELNTDTLIQTWQTSNNFGEFDERTNPNLSSNRATIYSITSQQNTNIINSSTNWDFKGLEKTISSNMQSLYDKYALGLNTSDSDKGSVSVNAISLQGFKPDESSTNFPIEITFIIKNIKYKKVWNFGSKKLGVSKEIVDANNANFNLQASYRWDFKYALNGTNETLKYFVNESEYKGSYVDDSNASTAFSYLHTISDGTKPDSLNELNVKFEITGAIINGTTTNFTESQNIELKYDVSTGIPIWGQEYIHNYNRGQAKYSDFYGDFMIAETSCKATLDFTGSDELINYIQNILTAGQYNITEPYELEQKFSDFLFPIVQNLNVDPYSGYEQNIIFENKTLTAPYSHLSINGSGGGEFKIFPQFAYDENDFTLLIKNSFSVESTYLSIECKNGIYKTDQSLTQGLGFEMKVPWFMPNASDNFVNYMNNHRNTLATQQSIAKLNIAKSMFSLKPSIGGIASSIQQYQLINSNIEDIKNQPEQIKNDGGNLINDVESRSLNPILTKWKLPIIIENHYKEKFIRNGYAVLNKHLNFNDLIKTRYWFNYIQADNVYSNINLQVSFEIKQVIADNLKQGMRIWHIRKDMNLNNERIGVLNYNYNNIEMSFVKTT